MKGRLLRLTAPACLVLLVACWPLLSGERTLFLRDVFNVHLGFKAAQVQAEGDAPLVAEAIAGGQPLAGNPNAVPFYPTNVLFRIAPILWAFNAHFWIHLLLAPWAMFWLARAWGLSPPAAWGAGVFYGTSGFFLSHLSFYNLVAGAALAPALIAAVLGFQERPGRRRAVLVALLWAASVLAGEPLMAGVALGLALLAALCRGGRAAFRPRPLLGFGSALLCGTLLAAPLIVEVLRVLPLSFRGHRGYSLASSLNASFHPAQIWEWVLPFAFGRPDQLKGGAFWAYELYGGLPPFFFTLAPGILVLALVAVSGLKKEPARLWAWIVAGGGFFLALGAHNPVAEAFFLLPGAQLLRYPVKLWLAVALGGALLAGLGLECWLRRDGAARRLPWILGAAGGFYLLFGLAFALFPEAAAVGLRSLVPQGFGDAFLALEVARWRNVALASAVTVALLVAVLFLGRRKPWPAVAALAALHGASQLFLLQGALATDEAAAYRETPAIFEHLPAEVPIVHGDNDQLFGPVHLKAADYPEPTGRWIQRRTLEEAYPFAGILHGRRYELNLTPEGLSSFLTRAARDALLNAPDLQRILLLKAWGVGRLVLSRPLEPPAQAHVRLLARHSSYGHEVFVYEILDAAPLVTLATEQVFAPHLNAALGTLTRPGFDAGRTVVVPGDGAPVKTTPGEVKVHHQGSEELIVTVRSEEGGALVWQRSHLPLFKATVDGRPAPLAAANLHRIAVPVPPGKHRVVIRTDHRPSRTAWIAFLVGTAAIVVLASKPRRPGEGNARENG